MYSHCSQVPASGSRLRGYIGSNNNGFQSHATPAQVEHHQVDDPQPGHDQHERQESEGHAGTHI